MLFNNSLKFPTGVNMSCIYGTGTQTPLTVNYDSNWKVKNYSNTSGDGTVPIESATSVCQEWKDMGNSVDIIPIQGAEHVGLIKTKQVFGMVLSALQ